MLKEDFLESYFQYKLDEAAIYAALPADEDNPYEGFYKARDIIKNVLADEMLKDDSDPHVAGFKGLLHFQLGMNHFETEETGSAKTHFVKSLELFAKLPAAHAVNFFNQIQVIFNNLGLLNLNIGELHAGLGYLLKAEKLYEKSMEIIDSLGYTVCNSMEFFSIKLRDFCSSPEERAEDPKKFAMVIRHPTLRPVFRFYYEGGLDVELTEKSYTLTCFYLAQAYAKKEDSKDKSAEYCGITLKRQVDCGDYESKDWANNSMGLAEFYKQEKMYSQAIYIIFTALEVLPKNRHFKTKASLRIMLGNILNDQLDYNARLIRGDTLRGAAESEVQKLTNHMNRKALVFEGVKVHFPHTKLYRSYEEVKELFKMANTEYKKALETYPLDGHVTEHVNILKEISRLYKHLSLLETDTERKVSMELRRKELIDPVYKSLNPKVYVSLWRVDSTHAGALHRASVDLQQHLRAAQARALPERRQARLQGQEGQSQGQADALGRPRVHRHLRSHLRVLRDRGLQRRGAER